MKALLLLVAFLISFHCFSQDSVHRDLKYLFVFGIGVGTGQYIEGGGAGTAAVGVNSKNNNVFLSFFVYNELQIFNAMSTNVFELSLTYHRSIPIGSFEASLGTGVSFNKHVIDTARFRGVTSFETITMTNAGLPVYITLGYKKRKGKIQLQYHYNFNSINKFKGLTLNAGIFL